MPVVPEISAHARDVYRLGLIQGNDPHAFAKVGDCETLTDWFLVDFDRGARYFYASLGARGQPYLHLVRQKRKEAVELWKPMKRGGLTITAVPVAVAGSGR